MKKRYAGFALAAVMLGASITGCGKNAQQAPAESLETEAAADGNEQQQAAASKGKWDYKEAELTMLIDSDYVQEGIKAVCDLAEQELGKGNPPGGIESSGTHQSLCSGLV